MKGRPVWVEIRKKKSGGERKGGGKGEEKGTRKNVKGARDGLSLCVIMCVVNTGERKGEEGEIRKREREKW